MRVLHVTPSFAPAWVYGGPVKTVYKLCLALQDLGNSIVVITTNANGPSEKLRVNCSEEELIEGDIRVRYCNRIGRVSMSFQMLALLPRYIMRADVVHLTGVYSFPTIPTLFFSRMIGKPVVWSPRGALQEWQGTRLLGIKRIWNWICGLAAPGRLVLHVTSQTESEESQPKFPNAEMAKIPNGVDIVNSHRDEKLSKELRLLFLGRLHPKKGVDNLLKAVALVQSNSDLNFRLNIAGVGSSEYERKLIKTIENLGITNCVEMLGFVMDEGKPELFSNTDVLVVPSYTENFAIVVSEALAHAVPVIASTGTPWADLEKTGCGLWVSNDPESLSDAIVKMSKAPIEQMGLRGQEWMRKAFNWIEIAKQMEAVYKSQIEG